MTCSGHGVYISTKTDQTSQNKQINGTVSGSIPARCCKMLQVENSTALDLPAHCRASMDKDWRHSPHLELHSGCEGGVFHICCAAKSKS